MMTRVAAVAVLTFGLLAGLLAQAGAAGAHATLIAGDPAADTERTELPPRVSATFNEPMQPQFAAMTVIGPDGDQWSDGEPAVDGAVISVGVRAGGPAGEYAVNYRATSADGHVVSGSWSFRLVAAATGTAAPPATAAPQATAPEPSAADAASEGPPMWPFVAATTAIVAAGAVWAVRRRS